jgi:hypothetical protein
MVPGSLRVVSYLPYRPAFRGILICRIVSGTLLVRAGNEGLYGKESWSRRTATLRVWSAEAREARMDGVGVSMWIGER